VKSPEIDISLLEVNLAMTPEERLRQHQEALNLLEALTNAKAEVADGRPQSAPSKTPRSAKVRVISGRIQKP
jgi:hypothetical protein